MPSIFTGKKDYMYAIGDEKWAGLAKLVEEAGEVQQAIGKLMALGGDGETPHFDGAGPIRERLEDELADLMAAISFVAKVNDLNRAHIELRMEAKYNLFLQWHEREKKP